MDKFESKLLKLIFKAGTSNLVKLDLSKLKYDDRLLINDFIEKLPKRPIVSAFTATATLEVREDIIRILKLFYMTYENFSTGFLTG